MIQPGAIEEKCFEKSSHSKTLVSLKINAGVQFIDVRKWFKWSNQDEYYPTKLGIMLDINDWKAILPMIQSFIDENTESKTANTDGK